MKTLSKALTLTILVALVAGTAVSAYAANKNGDDKRPCHDLGKDRHAHHVIAPLLGDIAQLLRAQHS